MKIWVVIPAYNEERYLRPLLLELKQKGFQTLVIDDGSRDSTYQVAKLAADLVIRNERNLGKGLSLQKAITRLLRKNTFDYIVTMDADGQHSVADIPKFINEAKNGEKFIVGNRMHKPLKMPAIRIFTNKLMSFLISKIVRQEISDTQCGFRLIKREVLEKIKVQTNKFEVESEILIKAAKTGFRIKSVDIESIYFKNRRSKIHPFVDTIRFLRFILNLKNL
jgi:glycosyltransferase involved in cell wall biosynthesis